MSHCIFNMSKSTCTIRMLVGLRRKGMAFLEGKQTIYMRGGMAYMNGVRDDGGLKYSQNVFFRYLSCPEHCNLAISENSLKALISEAIQRLF